jgi:copper chaperone NosL
MGQAGSTSAVNGVIQRLDHYFDRELTLVSRMLIIAGVLLLIPVYLAPMYQMTLVSNQFPDGLELHIYASKLEGGSTANRDDLREINTLNHYIGMRPLLESDFSEFKWLPLAVGVFALLALRAVVIGKMSKLVDVVVLFVYFGLFSFWSFYRRLYEYGHNLDPTAAVKVKSFTPPLFGTHQIANFTVTNMPQVGSYLMVAFALCLIAAVWHSSRHTPAEPRSV